MSDDQNTTQNQDSVENSILPSPQEPIADAPILPNVSDATASRYLSQLEKEGKIKQEGKTGRGVSYSKMI